MEVWVNGKTTTLLTWLSVTWLVGSSPTASAFHINKLVMSKNNSGNGIGFCGLLAIVFIVLKLCSVITWSWWWVLAPLWIPFALGLCFLIVTLMIGALVAAIDGRKD